MEQPGQFNPRLVGGLVVVLDLPIDVRDSHFGAENVDLGNSGEAVALVGDFEKALGQSPGLPQEDFRVFVEMKVVVSPLDVGNYVELSRGQLEQGDLDVVLGGLSPQFQGPAPRKLLGQQGGIRHVTHERILGSRRGNGEDRVRDDRIIERRDLRDAVLEGQNVELGRSHGAILFESVTNQHIQRLRPTQIGNKQSRPRSRL